MITDNQRREVARKLRDIKRVDLGDGLVCLSCDLGEVLGFDCADDYHIFEVSVNRLADLIDRPTCETIEHGRPYESHVCKSCSRCSYGWFEDIHDKPYSYCPNCGAEVVNDD